MKSSTRLKTILASRLAAILPGTPNALFARVIAQHGFQAVYVTGAGIANMSYGFPDIGLVTLAELCDHVAAIADAVELPILVDADTGFGNPLNVIRTVRLLERAGAAGIQLEDQVFPKKCGHFAGKQVIPRAEMVQKIKAACDARRTAICRSWRAPMPARSRESPRRSTGRRPIRGGRGRDLCGGAGRCWPSSRRIARELSVRRSPTWCSAG